MIVRGTGEPPDTTTQVEQEWSPTRRPVWMTALRFMAYAGVFSGVLYFLLRPDIMGSLSWEKFLIGFIIGGLLSSQSRS